MELRAADDDPLNDEDHPHFTLEKGRSAHIGAIHFFKVYDFVMCFGPHWYFSIVLLATIIAVGVCFTMKGFAMDDYIAVLAGVILTTATTITFLCCSLASPGILQPNSDVASSTFISDKHEVQQTPSRGDRVCGHCNIKQPAKAFHCQFCKVCISDFDHHCPWTSKCVGGENLEAFNTFVSVAFGALFFVVVYAFLFLYKCYRSC